MVTLQILSKVLQTGDNSIIEENMLGVEYFQGYEAEYEFIQNHLKKYGNVPDKATFLSQFPDIELVEVNESDKYLVNTVREEYLYYQSVPVVQHIAELLKSDSNAAAEYMMSQMSVLQPTYDIGGIDIIADAKTDMNSILREKTIRRIGSLRVVLRNLMISFMDFREKKNCL